MSVGLEKANDPVYAQIQFVFDAKGTDGSTVNYNLQLFGTIDEADNWAPAVGDPNKVDGGTFTIGHLSGPGSKVACTSAGSLDFSLEVENTTP